MHNQYLFFKSQDMVHLLDALRPRNIPGKKIDEFHFDPQSDGKRYGDLKFVQINNSQLERIMSPKSSFKAGKRPIYTVANMVSARLVDFSSVNKEPKIKSFRVDFYSPVRKENFAYASAYDGCKFGDGKGLEKLRLEGYNHNEPIYAAVKAAFNTFSLALVKNNKFLKYNNRGLLLLVESDLINRENQLSQTESS